MVIEVLIFVPLNAPLSVGFGEVWTETLSLLIESTDNGHWHHTAGHGRRPFRILASLCHGCACQDASCTFRIVRVGRRLLLRWLRVLRHDRTSVHCAKQTAIYTITISPRANKRFFFVVPQTYPKKYIRPLILLNVVLPTTSRASRRQSAAASC